MGDIIVLAVLAVVVAAAIRSLWKDHKKGGCAGCSHNCAGCTSACGADKNSI